MEEKEINIAEILNGCSKGTELYSPAFGKVFVSGIDSSDDDTIITETPTGRVLNFTKEGRYAEAGECMLFPSKDQRNWSKFKKPIVPPFEIIPPKKGQTFFFINALLEVEEISDKDHIGLENDSIKMGFEVGNYFNTEEQAEYAAQKVKELLLSLRKEAGNE